MSKILAVLADRFIESRNKVKDINGNWVDQTKRIESQHMADGWQINVEGGHTIFEVWDKKVIIDSFEFGTSDEGAYPKIAIADGDEGRNYTNQLLHVINVGSGRSFPYPENIVNRGSQFLEAEYASGLGKVTLKQPIILPDGCHFSFDTTTEGGSGTVTYKVYWREIEE